MISLQTISLRDILPPSIASDPAIAAAAAAIDAELWTVTAEIRKLNLIGRAAEWSNEETDELAWQYNTPYYDPELPLAKRRLLVENSMLLQRHKGTPKAIESVLSIIFQNAKVSEWFEYGGMPGHFKVSVQEILTESVYAKAIAAINAVKRLSSVLDTIETLFEYRSGLTLSNKFSILSYPYQAFASTTLYAGVPYAGPKVVNIPANPIYVGGGVKLGSTFSVTLQAAHPITGLVFAGNSGVVIPPIVIPADQEVSFSSGEILGRVFSTKLQEVYRLTGTVYSGGELIK